MNTTTGTTTQPQLRLANVRSIPAEGLAHPVFHGMGPADHLIAAFGYARPLDAAQLSFVRDQLAALERLPRGNPQEGIFAVFDPFTSEQLLSFRVTNLAAPRDAVASLMARLNERGVVFKDAWFTRWAMLPHLGVMGPLPDPRMPPTRPGYPNPRAYLDDLWNPTAIMPASEFDRELKGAFMARGDNLVLEMRGMPLFWPGWRIGYGLHPILDLPADPRADAVAQKLVAHLAARWRDVFKAPGKEHMRPVPRDRDWTEDRVSKVRCGTRVGYTFSIESVQLLDWPAPPVCRFREAELFEAVLTAASELALAPVVTWQRFGKDLMMMGPLRKPEEVVIQLWERGGEHGSHPDLDESLDPDDEDYDD